MYIKFGRHILGKIKSLTPKVDSNTEFLSYHLLTGVLRQLQEIKTTQQQLMYHCASIMNVTSMKIILLNAHQVPAEGRWSGLGSLVMVNFCSPPAPIKLLNPPIGTLELFYKAS